MFAYKVKYCFLILAQALTTYKLSPSLTTPHTHQLYSVVNSVSKLFHCCALFWARFFPKSSRCDRFDLNEIFILFLTGVTCLNTWSGKERAARLFASNGSAQQFNCAGNSSEDLTQSNQTVQHIYI